MTLAAIAHRLSVAMSHVWQPRITIAAAGARAASRSHVGTPVRTLAHLVVVGPPSTKTATAHHNTTTLTRSSTTVEHSSPSHASWYFAAVPLGATSVARVPFAPSREAAAAPPSAPTLLVERAVNTVERIAAGSRRIEDASRRMALAPARAAAIDVASIGRVVQSSIAATRPNEVMPKSPVSHPAASIGIDQLADQVIQQLDNRLVAFRERRGQAF